jgi:hypothetical protein
MYLADRSTEVTEREKAMARTPRNQGRGRKEKSDPENEGNAMIARWSRDLPENKWEAPQSWSKRVKRGCRATVDHESSGMNTFTSTMTFTVPDIFLIVPDDFQHACCSKEGSKLRYDSESWQWSFEIDISAAQLSLLTLRSAATMSFR